MKTKLVPSSLRAVLLAISALAAVSANAVQYLWNVAVPAANNWNVNANWSPNTGNPGSADTVKFGVIGTNTSASETVNNVVSTSTTITSLAYTNWVGWHVTQIPAGVTLTVTGGATFGGYTNETSQQNVGMVDAGTLYVSGGNFIVGIGANSAVQTITNDFAGLSNFVYNASAGSFNLCNSNRNQGTMFLAGASNNITCATANIGTGSSSSTVNSFLKLGSGTNIINASTVNLSAGRGSATVQFPGATGGLRMRGTGGTDADRVTMIAENNNTGGTGGGTRTATISFNGHPVDIKFATLTLGQQTGANTNCVGVGVLSFDSGTVDATTINMAISTGGTNTDGARGTMNVGTGGSLIVGAGGVSLVNIVPQLGTGESAIGNLNISGTATVAGNIIKTTTAVSTGNVSITNGSLTMSAYNNVVGTAAVPIDNLNLSNATVHLRADATGNIISNICSATVTATGANTIVIDAVTGVAGPTTFPLIAYTTLNGTVAGNFSIAVPGGYIASLVDNSAQQRIDLSITPSVIIVPLVWTGATNGDWDLVTSNWSAAGSAAIYSDASATIFDDTGLNTNVNLTTALLPLSMVMSNVSLTYTFNGTGSIGGTNTLTVKGAGTTIFDNSGSNSFTGGISISAGTLQVGNSDANGNLPDAQAVTDNSSLVFKRSDSHTNSSVISGAGSLTQSGGGTLTLVGANSYGATTISSGTLQVGAGGTSGSLGTGGVTDNGALTFNRSDNVTIANVINGGGTVTKIGGNILTLSGGSGYGGGLAVNAGTVRLANVSAGGTGTITVNPDATVVLGVSNIVNAVTLAGGALGFGSNQNPLKMEVTAAPGTTSTFFIADPANLGATDASEIASTNVWHGSGTVIVATVTNDVSPDSGNGFRMRTLASGDFSGTIIISNSVKGELQTTVAGPFSPASAGKMVVTCGVLTNNTVTGTFAELNLRNNFAGATVMGNDIEVSGNGFATLDPLGSAPDGSSVTMGNLKVGAGQELGVNVNGTAGTGFHTVVFTTATLNGGNATLSPKTSGWNTTPQVGSDLTLGNITELSAGSGFTMAGLRTLTLNGASGNAYSGPTTNANGTLVLAKTSGNAIPGNIFITGGSVNYSNSDQIANGGNVTVSGGSLNLAAFNDTVGAVSLTSGAITGSGILTGSSYDSQAGSVSASLGGMGTLTKSTAGTVSLSGNNSYTGGTLINAGILQLSGSGTISGSTPVTVAANATLDAGARTDGTFMLNSSQTLNGFGTVTGLVVAASGSTLAPGSASTIGTLTVSSNATLAGLAYMKIDRSTPTNDILAVVGTLTEGGTLTVTNIAGTLAVNDTFKLFNAATFSGAFAATNLPALGSGLGWNTSALGSSGSITVVATVNPNPTNIVASVSGSMLTLSWPADHTGWRLQVQTNSLANGLGANWSDVPGSTSVNTVNFTLDPANGSVFYRMVYP